jgi:hypothetical protein
MLLQVLRTLEGLATETALVRFEGDMDSDVRGDMITFDGAGVASFPATDEIQVIGALASDMSFTEMFL